MAPSRRIKLIEAPEVEDLYSRPEFNAHEQILYFSIDGAERELLNKYTKLKSRVYFVLQLGYFKAKHQFFDFELEQVQADAEFVAREILGLPVASFYGKLSPKHAGLQRAAILSALQYRSWSSEFTPQMVKHASLLLRHFPKSRATFRQLLIHFDRQRIVIPAYRIFQNIIGTAHAAEQQRLDGIVAEIPATNIRQLKKMIVRENGVSQLNTARTDQKDFQYTAIKNEIEKAALMRPLYLFCKAFIPRLGIASNAVQYYAELVDNYPASRLRKIRKLSQYLYVMCFIHLRYRQVMDNLIISFVYHLKAIRDSAKTYSQMAFLEHSSKSTMDLPKLAAFLKWFPERDPSLTYNELNDAAFDILPKDQFIVLSEYLKGSQFDKEAAKWEFFSGASRIVSLYLRPIFLAVEFEYVGKPNHLSELMTVLKHHYGAGRTPAQLKYADDLGLTLPKRMIQYLKQSPSDQYVDPIRLEFYVYLKVLHQISRGKVVCNDAAFYCDIEHELVDPMLVEQAESIAQQFGYYKIPIYCDARLDEALRILELTWKRVTSNIDNGLNPGFNDKGTKNGKPYWTLKYDSYKPEDDQFFTELPKFDIVKLVRYIGDSLNMWDVFSHLKERHLKRESSTPLLLNACILAEAFSIGTEKMAELSDLDQQALRSTREDFIRVDTLCAANDCVSNYVKSLPIFELWNIIDNKVLADADGQKCSTSEDTIQSRFSKKHFGNGPGISIYTLIANYLAVNAKNIGLNEYEGSFLYDIISGNKTDIRIDMVTGDNHSLNQLNFLVLDSIDVEYVPSIKSIREASENLCAPELKQYGEGFLQPKTAADIDLIRSQKRGILRVLLSLLLQENTQTNIIRKLNSHTRYARLRAALFEYNKILRSTHVLNLIDDMALRKSIRIARNRTESYHQMQSMIRKVYNGIFKGKRITNNQISAHSARLVANCIIAYNSTILNAVYEKLLADNVDERIIERFARISPIAWTHLTMTGRYSFKTAGDKIDINQLAELIEKQLKSDP